MTSLPKTMLAMTFFVALGGVLLAQDESREPPIKYRFEVDGKSYPIKEGEPLKLSGNLTNPTITLHAEPLRDFSYGGIAFSYPRSFTFEASINDPAQKSWTLSGNDFKIAHYLIAGDLTADQFAAAMMGEFGLNNCTQAKTSITINGAKKEGTRLNVKLAGVKIAIDIFRLTSGKQTRLLTLQDSPDDAGRPSKESQETIPVLQKTFSIK